MGMDVWMLTKIDARGGEGGWWDGCGVCVCVCVKNDKGKGGWRAEGAAKAMVGEGERGKIMGRGQW